MGYTHDRYRVVAITQYRCLMQLKRLMDTVYKSNHKPILLPTIYKTPYNPWTYMTYIS